MAIAKLSDGILLSTRAAINALIAPCEIGTFALSNASARALATLPMPLTNGDGVAAIFDRDIQAPAGFSFRRIGCLGHGTAERPEDVSVISYSFFPGPTGTMTKAEEAQVQGVIHSNSVAERDYICTGLITKGLVLADGRQIFIYLQPGEWIHLAAGAKNWALTAQDAKTIAVSYFSAEPTAPFTYFPDIPVLVT